MDPSQRQLTGLDALAQGSHYALQQLHDAAVFKSGLENTRDRESRSVEDDGNNADKTEDGSAKTKEKSDSSLVRRRISRACDQCNQLRTKCDGKNPCAHCVEFGLACEYNREKKKRGKASRRELERQKQTSSSADQGRQESPPSVTERGTGSVDARDTAGTSKPALKRQKHSHYRDANTLHDRSQDTVGQEMVNSSGTRLPPISRAAPLMNQHTRDAFTRDGYPTTQMALASQTGVNMLPNPRLPLNGLHDRSGSIGAAEYGGSIDDYHRQTMNQNGHALLHGGLHPAIGTPTGVMHYGDSPYNSGHSPHSQNGLGAFRLGESPVSGGQNHNFFGASPNAGSPAWIQLPSPSAALYTSINTQAPSQHLRYPVLKPILPRISAIIPPSLACDLLELYFASSYSSFVQPESPYVLGFLFRKRSFMRQYSPRHCSPALLASMLWVAAQTSESSFLTSPPSARGRICQQLLELTISLLRPLIHTPAEGVSSQSMNPVINGVALGGFGVALQTARHDNESGTMGATGALDDVATYVNLATVVSASEYKGASLRWWNAAWSLARELKLGRELPPNPETPLHADEGTNEDGSAAVDISMHAQQRRVSPPGTVSEEEREERRRIWWLLYIVDRHLALCYNRPLFLLDAECEGLLQPEDDSAFQAGEYYPLDKRQENFFRQRGPGFECVGHGIFGYFLPLMTILGEIVDLNHARNHPRFGVRLRSGSDLDDMQHEISLQLDAYERSLEVFRARHAPGEKPNGNPDDKASPASSTSNNRMTEPVLLTKILVAYGTHLLHTLHILLNGKWDPINMIDDNDLWISSQSFISATAHAVSAAEAISGILDYDPDLSFMPFFFGIYLLQGSFLLLLIADKLQGEASPSVIRACEAIVRAHEVCVVTLNTEYQRNFRKVMRSALQQVRGRTIEDPVEQQQRRREVLALYRWCGDGTGLAL
ncbi:hypothetical protein AAFC00_001861 [Neodothiora populina]